MKKIIVIAFLLVASLSTTAQQVGINNPLPDASAVLDIKSSDKGLLIPRVTKSQRVNISNPASGLMIYQTGPDSTGFYYFQNTWHYINYDSMLPPSSIILSKTFPNLSLQNNNFKYGGKINIPNATITETLPEVANFWSLIDSVIPGSPTNGTVDLKSIWADSVFFLAGGYSGSNAGIPFYKYSPATGEWTMANSSSIMPKGANAARVGNKWIFWGGIAGLNFPYGSAFPAYIFDLNTFSLTQSATLIDSARTYNTATNIGSSLYFWGGKNILISSYTYGTGYKYNVTSNTWSAMTNNGAPSPRYYAGAIAAGTKLIIWGGNAPSEGISKTGAIYNTINNTWTPMSTTNAPTTGAVEPAMAYYNNQVYIISGSETKRFDPLANTWTTLAPPPYSFYGQKFDYDGNGKIYVWGGARYFYVGAPTTNGYIYDIATNSYTTIPNTGALNARAGHTLCAGNEGMMVWGGSKSTGFDPTTAESLKSGGIFYLNAQNVSVTLPLAPLYLYEKK